MQLKYTKSKHIHEESLVSALRVAYLASLKQTPVTALIKNFPVFLLFMFTTTILDC